MRGSNRSRVAPVELRTRSFSTHGMNKCLMFSELPSKPVLIDVIRGSHLTHAARPPRSVRHTLTAHAFARATDLIPTTHVRRKRRDWLRVSDTCASRPAGASTGNAHSGMWCHKCPVTSRMWMDCGAMAAKDRAADADVTPETKFFRSASRRRARCGIGWRTSRTPQWLPASPVRARRRRWRTRRQPSARRQPRSWRSRPCSCCPSLKLRLDFGGWRESDLKRPASGKGTQLAVRERARTSEPSSNRMGLDSTCNDLERSGDGQAESRTGTPARLGHPAAYVIKSQAIHGATSRFSSPVAVAHSVSCGSLSEPDVGSAWQPLSGPEPRNSSRRGVP